MLHPMELSRATLLAHRECDLLWLLRELSRAAFHLSKVRVFNLKGDEDA
jgi:hypothetical protein